MKAADWLVLRNADHVGRRVRLRGSPQIGNLGALRIGDDVQIDSLPVRTHLCVGAGGELVLADGASLAHGVGITAASSVHVGEGARIGAFSMVLDTDFHDAGDHHAPGASSPIRIGAGAILGPRVTVLRGARIGNGARVAAGSVVSGDVPAGAIVSGNPARVQAGRVQASSVAEIVQRVFALPSLPGPSDGPHSIAAWDSLGALRLLIALEESAGRKLREADLARAGSVADLDRLV
jgi:acetyltransferase-like isoleucine patch superfamily enzyme/acyl carrier protein